MPDGPLSADFLQPNDLDARRFICPAGSIHSILLFGLCACCWMVRRGEEMLPRCFLKISFRWRLRSAIGGQPHIQARAPVRIGLEVQLAVCRMDPFPDHLGALLDGI